MVLFVFGLAILFLSSRSHRNALTWSTLGTLSACAWIAEWYHTWLWSSVRCAMPWAKSLSLSDDKLFFGPKHNIYTFFMILFGLFNSILLFVCQICHVNCETENWKFGSPITYRWVGDRTEVSSVKLLLRQKVSKTILHKKREILSQFLLTRPHNRSFYFLTYHQPIGHRDGIGNSRWFT